MQSIALATVLDVLSVEERHAFLADPTLVTLQGVFAAVPDPRKRRGLRYDLPFLLTCLVAALLSNCNSAAAVGSGVGSIARSWPVGIPMRASSPRPAPCSVGCCPD